MTRTQGATIVLVRAIEEQRPDAIPPEALIDAAAAAGDVSDERAWLARRSEYLLEHVVGGYRPILSLKDALVPRLSLLVGAPLALGLATNYLGPSQKIHVLYNPIAALIVWNLAVYLLTAIRGALARRLRVRTRAIDVETTPGGGTTRRAKPTRKASGRPGPLPRWILRRAVPGIWLRFQRAAGEAREQTSDLARVGRSFWAHWTEVAAPLFALSFRRTLHVAAIGLTAGAVLGMFVRGLFWNYEMVWRSTFVQDPNAVAGLLAALLGPAAFVLGWPLPDAEAARRLMGPEGVGAADWIWLYAVSALLFVVLPRSLLALRATWRVRSIGGELDLGLGEPYYRRLLEAARTLHVERITEAIRTDVRIECGKFSEALAIFVGTTLFDERIAPKVRRFREQGGRLSALEQEVQRECEDFQAELARYVPVAQKEFERSLSRAIERTLGVELAVDSSADKGLAGRAGELTQGSTRAVAAPLEREFANVIGAAVAAALVAVTGTVSGGFGKVLGSALLVGLLGTTGPVAFLVGALGGLLLAVGAWRLGRERVADGVRQVSLPGTLVRMTLRERRLEALLADGRARCHALVKELADAELSPLTPAIAERIWTRVKPILAERQRPA